MGLLWQALDNADVPTALDPSRVGRGLRRQAVERSNRGRLQNLQGFSHGFVGCGAMDGGLRRASNRADCF